MSQNMHPVALDVSQTCGILIAEMLSHMHTTTELFELFARLFDIVQLKLPRHIANVDEIMDVVCSVCQFAYRSLTPSQTDTVLHDSGKRLADGYSSDWRDYYLQRWLVVQSMFREITTGDRCSVAKYNQYTHML